MAIENISQWLSGSSSIFMSTMQRKYIWTTNQACDLLNNIREKGISFFAGIAYKEDKKNNILKIVDGCQRLTTILLINKIYQASPSMYIQIQNKAIELKYVEDFDTDQLNKIMKTDFSNIDSIDKLKKMCPLWGLDAKKSNITKNFIALFSLYLEDKNTIHLQAVKNNFLHSCFYGMLIPDNCDEVDVFLNLNAKGTLVSLADMVKAFYPDDPNVDEKTYVNFNDLKKLFKRYEKDGQNQDAEFTRFLYKISCYKANSESSSKTKDLAFYESISFTDFKNYASMYLDIRDRNYVKFIVKHNNWPTFASNFMFGIYESNLSDKDLILDFICKWLYKNIPYIKTLKNDRTNFQRAKEGVLFKGLCDTLNDNPTLISLNYVKTKLDDFIKKECPDWIQKTKEGLTYSLGNKYIINIFENDLGYKVNVKDPTVEHIYAQNCELGPLFNDKDKNKKYINKLGNLTLLSQNLNSSVGKQAPVKKFNHDAYKNSGFGPTVDLMKMTQWTNKDIDERHEKFTDEWIAF